jgi:hypothetical protein
VRADPVLAGLAARSLLLASVVTLAAVPVYVYVEPSWRALVARLAAAFVVGVTLLQLRRVLVERIARLGGSALDEARERRPPPPGVPHRYLDLVRDVRTALRSRRYFEETLWPRLAGFTTRPPARPPARLGRGPSIGALGRALDVIERRP